MARGDKVMKQGEKLRVITGGKVMPNTVALQGSMTTTKSAQKTYTDWGELSDWGSSESLRIGLSEKDSEELLLQVRASLNDSSCR